MMSAIILDEQNNNTNNDDKQNKFLLQTKYFLNNVQCILICV